mmetsp:Transcript_16550/g.27027  ORF Transcript_16550/g.27027 Transcript_16550/m.27027 type:complete len:245 (-) Transcript_16550:295-1029(-)
MLTSKDSSGFSGELFFPCSLLLMARKADAVALEKLSKSEKARFREMLLSSSRSGIFHGLNAPPTSSPTVGINTFRSGDAGDCFGGESLGRWTSCRFPCKYSSSNVFAAFELANAIFSAIFLWLLRSSSSIIVFGFFFVGDFGVVILYGQVFNLISPSINVCGLGVGGDNSTSFKFFDVNVGVLFMPLLSIHCCNFSGGGGGIFIITAELSFVSLAIALTSLCLGGSMSDSSSISDTASGFLLQR